MKRLISAFLLLLILGSNTYAEEASYISLGDYSKDIISLHEKLIDLGLFQLRPESPYGPDSVRAVKVLQAYLGVEITGNINTHEELNSLISLDASKIFETNLVDIEQNIVDIKNAEIIIDQYNGNPGVLCTGSLKRDYNVVSLEEYLREEEYIGFRIDLGDISQLRYIIFWGRKVNKHGQPSVILYNEDGEVLAQCTERYTKISNEWKLYIIDVTDLAGNAYCIFNGGYVDSTGSSESKYIFSNIMIF